MVPQATPWFRTAMSRSKSAKNAIGNVPTPGNDANNLTVYSDGNAFAIC